MASNFLHSLTDENPDLQRQIGCMTGIFQIFDRHHVLTARHINPKKLGGVATTATSHFSHDTIETKGKTSINNGNGNGNANDKQRVVSIESSQASFSSSSRSSSFSSIDYSRTAQPETAFSFERVIFPDTPSAMAPVSQSSESPQFSNHHQSLDLRDVVKDSMLYREVELSDWTSLNLNQTGSSKSTWNLDGNGGVPRKSCNSTTNILAFPKDSPRFSYDLGENFKSTAPRLSLDSREGSLRKDSKPRLLRNSKSQREGSSCSTDLLSGLQQTPTIQKRLPSVVAKLMGLDALPANANQTMASTKTTVIIEEPKSSKQTAQGSLRREPTSPRRRNNDVVVMKPITTSRFPMEPAPWKQIDGGRRSQRSKTLIRSADTSPSVYGEIEKRMKDLEFTQAGKDLRALKQILEAMQTKGLLETEIEDDRKPAMKSRQVVNRSNSESPIVIIKPTKLVQKASRTNVRTPNPPQASSPRRSPFNNHPPEEKSNSAKASSPSISPRLQQKKLDLQKKSRPPTPPADSNRSRRQINSIQQPSPPLPPPPHESCSSPWGKRRTTKTLAKLKKEEKSNRNSDGYVVSDSGTESEVTSSFRPGQKLDLEELSSITSDQQPSPISVLDNSLYRDNDDNSTTVNTNASIKPETINRQKLENIELLVEKLKQLNSAHNEAQTDYIASLCEDTNPDHRYISEILLASGLILSNLGNEEEAFRFHQSGYPINPDLYLVLEQTKASHRNNNNNDNNKVHRKFVFDTVNEILTGKLSSVGTMRPVKVVKSCLNGQKLLKELCCEIDKVQIEANKKGEEENGWKSILWEDVINGTGHWNEFSGEISEAVLDVERLVFKDLVDEIVRGEEPVVAGRFRRKLFVH